MVAHSDDLEVIMNLESVLVLVVVLIVCAVVVSVVAPDAMAEIANALAPLQNVAETAPIQ